MFLATYESTGAYVAIKYLNATLRRDAEFMDRFRSDSPHLVEIDDPHTVRLYEYVETPDRAAVVMELVDGVSLRTLLAEHGRIGPEAALAVLKSTLLALGAAHERGVPHRDVQPGNILVQADGSTKLGDFGVVVHAEEPGVPAGSPAYMSPELWTQGRAGPPADLYAAACVLFEAVRGRPPYRTRGDGAPDVPALRDLHLTEPVPVETAPDSLRDLLRRGLAKDPADRYASARLFAAELEEDAAAAYGPEWEQRGRRHLAEQATLLALRFPLARTGGGPSVGAGLRARAARLPPQLWVAGATVVAVLIAVLLSGGRFPPVPGTILMPPPEAGTESETEPEPARTTTAPAATRTPSTPRRATASPPPSRVPATPPTPQGGTSVPLPTVRTVGISGWNGASGSVSVAASGKGPVRLRITYTRRDGDGGAATTVREETRTLRGRTAYTSAVGYAAGAVGCGRRVYAGVLVMTEPAAGNGPQVSEVAVDGPACPEPPASGSPSPSSASPSVPGSGSPTPTGAPASRPAASEPPGVRSSATGPPAVRASDLPGALSSESGPLPDGATGAPPLLPEEPSATPLLPVSASPAVPG